MGKRMFCSNCDMWIEEPSLHTPGPEWVRFHRGICPKCEAPLALDRQKGTPPMGPLFFKAPEIHDILEEYIKVHNHIFKFSLRRVMPIPGIFQAIDYGSHCQTLDSLKKRLEDALLSLEDADASDSLLAQHAQALLETISCFRHMCGNLYEKSQAYPNAYSKLQYKQDLETYKSNVIRYKALGIRLNEYMQGRKQEHSAIVSIENVVAVLVGFVGSWPALDLVKQCKDLGMMQETYFDTGMDNTLPRFDAGYRFKYITEDNVNATIEILERDKDVLQAGVQIVYPPGTSEKLVRKHYDEVKRVTLHYYGPATPASLGGVEILNWGNESTLFYLHRMFINNCHSIAFRAGNRKFWD